MDQLKNRVIAVILGVALAQTWCAFLGAANRGFLVSYYVLNGWYTY